MKTNYSIFALLVAAILPSTATCFTSCKGQGKKSETETTPQEEVQAMSQEEAEATDIEENIYATEGIIENNTYKAKYFGLTFRYPDTFKYSQVTTEEGEDESEGEEENKQQLAEPIKTEGDVTFYFDNAESEDDALSEMVAELSKLVNNVEIIYVEHDGIANEIIDAFYEGREKNADSYGEDGATIDKGERSISGKDFRYHIMKYKKESEVVDAMYFTIIKDYVVIFKTLSNSEEVRTEIDKMIENIQFS